MIKLTVLGVGTPFSIKHGTTSFILSFDDVEHNLLVEAPDRIFNVVNKYGNGIKLRDIDHVYISHIHGDHVNGLEPLGFWNRYSIQRRLHVFMGEGITSSFIRRFKDPMGSCGPRLGEHVELDFYFDIHPLKEGIKQIIDIGGKRIGLEIMKTTHCVPTYAFKLEYDGKCVGYSADTEFSKELVSFLKGCDVIIHELGNTPINHTTIEDLKQLPNEVLNKIYWIHYPDNISTYIKDENIRLLYEGEQIYLD